MIKITTLLFCWLILFGNVYAKIGGHHHGSSSCYIEVDDLNFGEYNPFDINPKTVPANLKITCRAHHSVNFSIKLIGGNSSDPNKRYLFSTSTGDKLYYNLYIDNCVFGDGLGSTCVISGRLRSHHSAPVERIYTILGVIFPMQNVKAGGDYRDTLIIQLEY
ncbi:spore coat protein U domain-containing protein [Persephonella sp.]